MDRKMETTAKASYPAYPEQRREAGFKPNANHQPPTLPIDASTTANTSFREWSVHKPTKPTWAQKPEYRPPDLKMSATSSYRDSFVQHEGGQKRPDPIPAAKVDSLSKNSATTVAQSPVMSSYRRAFQEISGAEARDCKPKSCKVNNTYRPPEEKFSVRSVYQSNFRADSTEENDEEGAKRGRAPDRAAGDKRFATTYGSTFSTERGNRGNMAAGLPSGVADKSDVPIAEKNSHMFLQFSKNSRFDRDIKPVETRTQMRSVSVTRENNMASRGGAPPPARSTRKSPRSASHSVPRLPTRSHAELNHRRDASPTKPPRDSPTKKMAPATNQRSRSPRKAPTMPQKRHDSPRKPPTTSSPVKAAHKPVIAPPTSAQKTPKPKTPAKEAKPKPAKEVVVKKSDKVSSPQKAVKAKPSTAAAASKPPVKKESAAKVEQAKTEEPKIVHTIEPPPSKKEEQKEEEKDEEEVLIVNKEEAPVTTKDSDVTVIKTKYSVSVIKTTVDEQPTTTTVQSSNIQDTVQAKTVVSEAPKHPATSIMEKIKGQYSMMDDLFQKYKPKAQQELETKTEDSKTEEPIREEKTEPVCAPVVEAQILQKVTDTEESALPHQNVKEVQEDTIEAVEQNLEASIMATPIQDDNDDIAQRVEELVDLLPQSDGLREAENPALNNPVVEETLNEEVVDDESILNTLEKDKEAEGEYQDYLSESPLTMETGDTSYDNAQSENKQTSIISHAIEPVEQEIMEVPAEDKSGDLEQLVDSITEYNPNDENIDQSSAPTEDDAETLATSVEDVIVENAPNKTEPELTDDNLFTSKEELEESEKVTETETDETSVKDSMDTEAIPADESKEELMESSENKVNPQHESMYAPYETTANDATDLPQTATMDDGQMDGLIDENLDLTPDATVTTFDVDAAQQSDAEEPSVLIAENRDDDVTQQLDDVRTKLADDKEFCDDNKKEIEEENLTGNRDDAYINDISQLENTEEQKELTENAIENQENLPVANATDPEIPETFVEQNNVKDDLFDVKEEGESKQEESNLLEDSQISTDNVHDITQIESLPTSISGDLLEEVTANAPIEMEKDATNQGEPLIAGTEEPLTPVVSNNVELSPGITADYEDNAITDNNILQPDNTFDPLGNEQQKITEEDDDLFDANNGNNFALDDTEDHMMAISSSIDDLAPQPKTVGELDIIRKPIESNLNLMTGSVLIDDSNMPEDIDINPTEDIVNLNKKETTNENEQSQDLQNGNILDNEVIDNVGALEIDNISNLVTADDNQNQNGNTEIETSTLIVEDDINDNLAVSNNTAEDNELRETDEIAIQPVSDVIDDTKEEFNPTFYDDLETQALDDVIDEYATKLEAEEQIENDNNIQCDTAPEDGVHNDDSLEQEHDNNKEELQHMIADIEITDESTATLANAKSEIDNEQESDEITDIVKSTLELAEEPNEAVEQTAFDHYQNKDQQITSEPDIDDVADNREQQETSNDVDEEAANLFEQKEEIDQIDHDTQQLSDSHTNNGEKTHNESDLPEIQPLTAEVSKQSMDEDQLAADYEQLEQEEDQLMNELRVDTMNEPTEQTQSSLLDVEQRIANSSEDISSEQLPPQEIEEQTEQKIEQLQEMKDILAVNTGAQNTEELSVEDSEADRISYPEKALASISTDVAAEDSRTADSAASVDIQPEDKINDFGVDTETDGPQTSIDHSVELNTEDVLDLATNDKPEDALEQEEEEDENQDEKLIEAGQLDDENIVDGVETVIDHNTLEDNADFIEVADVTNEEEETLYVNDDLSMTKEPGNDVSNVDPITTDRKADEVTQNASGNIDAITTDSYTEEQTDDLADNEDHQNHECHLQTDQMQLQDAVEDDLPDTAEEKPQPFDTTKEDGDYIIDLTENTENNGKQMEKDADDVYTLDDIEAELLPDERESKNKPCAEEESGTTADDLDKSEFETKNNFENDSVALVEINKAITDDLTDIQEPDLVNNAQLDVDVNQVINEAKPNDDEDFNKPGDDDDETVAVDNSSDESIKQNAEADDASNASQDVIKDNILDDDDIKDDDQSIAKCDNNSEIDLLGGEVPQNDTTSSSVPANNNFESF